MSWIRVTGGVLLMLFACASPARPVHAAECPAVLDQSWVPPAELGSLFGAAIYPRFIWAQTLTVGTAGEVAGVGIMATRSNTSQHAGEFIVELRRTIGDLPDLDAAALFGSAAIPFDDLPDDTVCRWVDVDFPGQGVTVVEGDRLAIVMRTTGETGGICGSFAYPAGDHYPGGRALLFESSTGVWRGATDPWQGDFTFRVYVCPLAVPVEPATWGRLKASYRD